MDSDDGYNVGCLYADIDFLGSFGDCTEYFSVIQILLESFGSSSAMLVLDRNE